MANNKKECYGSMVMKCIPKDVHNFILDKQTEFKKQRAVVTPVSMETTVIRLLKSHPEFKGY